MSAPVLSPPVALVAVLLLGAAGCGHLTPPPAPSPEPAAEASAEPAHEVGDAVAQGELPWWHAVPDGVYRSGDVRAVVAIGRSSDHHHVVEGFLHAKVSARLAARKAAEGVRWPGAVPEPELADLFITRARTFLVLYRIRVPDDAGLPAVVPALSAPALVRSVGRRRVGRHVYEDDRHLYLECEVEGPIANPDWGRTRAAARG